ncbi:U-box domain-containing protein 35 isoform X2 [Jatropha curcas]|nr:U-box domain-containing protein 35 isoform X2 [Jatropha curcas]
MDNLVNNKSHNCILVHVQSKIASPEVCNLSKEGRPPTHQELQQLFLPYRGFCARKGIETKEVVLHDIDVSSALIDYIVHNRIANIVVGASHRHALTRKFKHADTPSTLLKSAPESCAVYVISKGKIQTFRLASRPRTLTGSTRSTSSAHSTGSADSISSANACLLHQSPPRNSSKHSKYNNVCTTGQPNLWEQRHLPKDRRPSVDVSQRFCESWKSDGSDKTSSSSGASEFSGQHSFQSSGISSENLEFSTTCAGSKSPDSSQIATLDAEMKRLKLELEQSMQMFSSVSKEAVFAKQMVRKLRHLQKLEARKTEETTEDAALTLEEMEKRKTIIALEAVQAASRAAEIEAQKKNVEMKAHREAEDKMRKMEALANNDFRCRRYTIEEIEVATDHFSPANKIGEGAYGPVFKGMLNHIAVAIKILRPDLSQGLKQFKQEVDVLSSMRHPYMVILLGACPEYGCLVYEYMENGSLEDRLNREDNTPPIPWGRRFKIAYEIATALLFLHETKPEPLVHRDLKPANILLDCNYVSKISDVGLARLLPPSAASDVTQYRMTAAAGTFYYIDPEYQQTGMLGVKSDLYSFGVVLLQLLTAKPPMGLAYQVQEAIEKGTFSDILDQSITDWPVNEALLLARLAVQCCELRKKDRPDLASVVWPELKRLKDLSMSHEASQHRTILSLPSPDDLVSEASTHSNEINAKGGWQLLYLNGVKRLRSLKNNSQKSSIDHRHHGHDQRRPRPTRNRAVGITKMMPFPVFCSSFGSCTVVPHPAT